MENSEYDHYKSAGARGRAGKKLKGRTSKNRRCSLDPPAKKNRVKNPQKSNYWASTNPRLRTNQMKVRFNHYVNDDSNKGALISTETELNQFVFRGIKDDHVGQVDKNHESEIRTLKKQKCRRDHLVI
mmetsp:Transcript_60921/g.69677  ORF Transcript_60921/g.69677 Transcript_60921/m.69677 type:complete len:128 (-) Transcript_60921:1082-1465(-)|eukprot:CAMPEP_0115010568 /NCGR_PEP_ID=MMETSP0216-20121206/23397_1 /TAXON_ID=223996 /ORGANISM="Protocruzia adherens, Strain Boccale" /LENGTH=127 /DNA_ID=CAMNT_0002378815 /DNA_START=22 /DNA_END=405 /DNA_ORIENTATION=+